MNGHNLGKFEIKEAIFDLRVDHFPNPTNWYWELAVRMVTKSGFHDFNFLGIRQFTPYLSHNLLGRGSAWGSFIISRENAES